MRWLVNRIILATATTLLAIFSHSLAADEATEICIDKKLPELICIQVSGTFGELHPEYGGGMKLKMQSIVDSDTGKVIISDEKWRQSIMEVASQAYISCELPIQLGTTGPLTRLRARFYVDAPIYDFDSITLLATLILSSPAKWRYIISEDILYAIFNSVDVDQSPAKTLLVSTGTGVDVTFNATQTDLATFDPLALMSKRILCDITDDRGLSIELPAGPDNSSEAFSPSSPQKYLKLNVCPTAQFDILMKSPRDYAVPEI